MSKSQKKQKTQIKIAMDRIVFGGGKREAIATTIPDPNFIEPPKSEHGNILVFQRNLLLCNIMVEKVLPKGRHYLVRLVFEGNDGLVSPQPPHLIPQIMSFTNDVCGQYSSAQTESKNDVSRSYTINIIVEANRDINFIRHAAQIAKCACDHLGVDLARKYSVDRWTDQRKVVSWLHLNCHERKTEFLYKGKWIPEKEYFDLYISEMLGFKITVFAE